jgi:hypothetical protein
MVLGETIVFFYEPCHHLLLIALPFYPDVL